MHSTAPQPRGTTTLWGPGKGDGSLQWVRVAVLTGHELGLHHQKPWLTGDVALQRSVVALSASRSSGTHAPARELSSVSVCREAASFSSERSSSLASLNSGSVALVLVKTLGRPV